MTKQDLLKASIKEFEDKKENCLLWKCDRVFTSSGYCYLIKKTSEPFSCAFHFARSFETSDEIGKYENVEIALNTRKEIGFEDGIITYRNLSVALFSQGNYNETMGQWHYRGVGTFSPISNQFLITSEEEISDNLGVNSMEIFLRLKSDYPYVPSYFEAKSEKKYIMVDVENSESLGGALRLDEDGLYRLHKADDVKLTFVNFTRNEAMAELYKIQEASKEPETRFGFMSEPTLENKYMYQIAFNWKSLTYISNFRINYEIASTDPETILHIKEAVLDQLEAL